MPVLVSFLNCIKSIKYKRDKSIVILDAWFGKRYADNSRYLYEYLSKNKEFLGLSHVVWVSRNPDIVEFLNNKGYEAYAIDSKESVYYHKKAYYHICNNSPTTHDGYLGELLTEFSFGAKRINLWHGTGAIKNVCFASNDYKRKTLSHPILYKIKNNLYKNFSLYRSLFSGNDSWNDCYYLSTSQSERDKMMYFFNLPYSKIIISGYPRNCKNIDLTKEELNIIKEIKKHKFSILYLPTFRWEGSDFDYKKVAMKIHPILIQKDILWIQKAHSVNNDASNYSINENILTLDSDFDVNTITPYVTAITTDYSSILADALYHRKPVYLYVPDYKEYVEGERGISVDGEYLLSSGFKFYDLEGFYNFLERSSFKEFPPNYEDVRKKIWGEKDKEIGDIWEDIKKQVR